MNQHKRGAMLFEALVSTAVLGTALAITAQLSGLAHVQQRSAERRGVALAEAANLMERAAALPADQIAPEFVTEWKLSDIAVSRLPEARLAVSVVDEPGEVSARRLSVEIRWRNRAGQDDAPVRLTSWFYPTTGGAAATETSPAETPPEEATP
ncbi:MAG: hypothetical protein KF708_03200 [Pirellulales bacterium]|nr:hypothetical protein [Pirellulales bacterium]